MVNGTMLMRPNLNHRPPFQCASKTMYMLNNHSRPASPASPLARGSCQRLRLWADQRARRPGVEAWACQIRAHQPQVEAAVETHPRMLVQVSHRHTEDLYFARLKRQLSSHIALLQLTP